MYVLDALRLAYAVLEVVQRAMTSCSHRFIPFLIEVRLKKPVVMRNKPH